MQGLVAGPSPLVHTDLNRATIKGKSFKASNPVITNTVYVGARINQAALDPAVISDDKISIALRTLGIAGRLMVLTDALGLVETLHQQK